MSPIRLAIIFDQRIHAGGGYQQALNAALLARELSPELVEPVYFTTFEENVATLSAHGIEAIFLPLSRVARLKIYLRRLIQYPRLLAIVQRFAPLNPSHYTQL